MLLHVYGYKKIQILIFKFLKLHNSHPAGRCKNLEHISIIFTFISFINAFDVF